MVAFLNEDVMLGLLFTDKRVFLAEANWSSLISIAFWRDVELI